MAKDPLDFTNAAAAGQVPAGAPDAQAAAELIRQKVEAAYQAEPNAKQELVEADASHHRSPHQQFMHELSTSGKDLATIQTEWHNYYVGLSPTEQHQVWQEFYESQSTVTGQPRQPTVHAEAERKQGVVTSERRKSKPQPKKLRDARSTKEVRETIKHNVTAGGQLTAKHHLRALLFGLSIGLLVIFIYLFTFFNEFFIAPFIQPSRAQAATPVIVGTNSIAPTPTPEVIIPKINVEIPVNYNESSTNEADIENDLQDGVVHYPTTTLPGQNGNTAFFGHSSNNIFNKGKYKFAFVLLHTLVNGDTFYLTYNDKVYVYKVISRTIVSPNDVGVLDPVAGQTATATLITCDPPGTSINRLIVVGQQISPDPSTNTQGTTSVNTSGSSTSFLPGNGPTLWTRFLSTAAGKFTSVIVTLAVFLWLLRWIHKPVRRTGIAA